MDFEDFAAIYDECQGGSAPVGIGIDRDHQRYGTLESYAHGAGASQGGGYGRSSSGRQAASANPITGESARQAAQERKSLLKRAFAKYDVDNDGFISVEDLRRAFKAQGRDTPQSEIVAWVRRRDLSSIGAVCLEDFLESYSSNN